MGRRTSPMTSPPSTATIPPPVSRRRATAASMSSSSMPTTRRLWLSWATVLATAPRCSPSPCTKPTPIVPGPPWRSMLAALARSSRRIGRAPRRRPPAPRRSGARWPARRGPCRSRAPATRSPVAAMRRSVDRRRAGDADRVARPGRVLVVGGVCAADRLAVGQHQVRAHLREVLDEQDVRAAARGDRADVVAAAHVLGGVDRRHLDRHQRVDPRGDRGPHGVVEVADRGERLGVHVVGDEQRVARVDAVLEQHRGELLDVVPRRALAQLHPHPGAQLGQRVAAQHGLVVGVHAGGDVGVQAMVVPAVQAPVPGHRQPARRARRRSSRGSPGRTR